MALTATVYSFEVTLSDVDRGVYETLSFKVAQHPSESMDYMVTRLLAYCLEYCEGIQFGKGISQDEEPPVYARDLTGLLTLWVEVGMPDPDKVHRASKAAPRMAIYTHRDVVMIKRNFEGKQVHKSDELPLYALDPQFVRQLGNKIERRTQFDLSITEQELYLTIGGETLQSRVEEHRLA